MGLLGRCVGAVEISGPDGKGWKRMQKNRMDGSGMEESGSGFRYEKFDAYWQQLDWHLKNGTRPNGRADAPGVLWTNAAFAKGIPSAKQGTSGPGEPRKRIEGYRKPSQNNGYLPDPAVAEWIAEKMFGTNEQLREWRAHLAMLFNAARSAQRTGPRGNLVLHEPPQAEDFDAPRRVPFEERWRLGMPWAAQGRMAWLHMDDPRKGNSDDRVSPQVQFGFGMREGEYEGLPVRFELRRAFLAVGGANCQWDLASRHELWGADVSIREAGDRAEIVPPEGQQVLSLSATRASLGEVRRLAGLMTVAVRLTSYRYDVQITSADPLEEITDRKAAILEVFLQNRLLDQDGDVIWATADMTETGRA